MVNLKFQYAEAAFDWNSETFGYFLTGMGTIRSIHLIILLPLIIRIFGPKPPDPHLPRGLNDPSQPLLDDSQLTNSHESPNQLQRDVSLTPSHLGHVTRPHARRTAHFDLTIGRISLVVDFIGYTLISLSATGPQFFAFSMISAFGAGINPSMQVLALYLMPSSGKDAGKLFGALGMLGSLNAQITGPFLYGLVYMNTVATYPKAIFVVGAAVFLCAFIALSLVRLPRHTT